ncbi:MAG: T9SS type A sorting domain-containing protein, partial [Bacteroidales bacterium]|nr:T9SS type A sorting domain-containing protein [Bacteroidales bacterium]
PMGILNRGLSEGVPVFTLPVVDTIQLLKEDSLESATKTVAYRFGIDIDVELNPVNSGKWQNLANGDRLWQLAIESKNAYSLNLIFNKYNLAEGAKLFIYNKTCTEILGAFTSINNRDDKSFATTLLRGSFIIIEYYEPGKYNYDKKAENKTGYKEILNISKIIHGYKDLWKAAKGFGGSGKCNININCEEGANWQQEKKAVAMILTDYNKRICTGTLLNNAKADGTPYMLTAKHCTDGETIGTLVFIFNYESPDCSQTDGPLNMSITGAELKASSYISDFSLLELSSTPLPSYNVYYSGWSATTEASDSCISIHHPSGDIKKISFDYGTIELSDWDSGVLGSHWTVGNWEKGTTEQGSSGAALYNKQHQVIGQLHGGSASCVSQTDDNFGCFAYSYDKSSALEMQLKHWLDPDNTGIKSMKGKDFNMPELALDASVKINLPDGQTICDNYVKPTITIKNNGAEEINKIEIKYRINKGNLNSYIWTGTLKYLYSAKINLEKLEAETGINYLEVWLDKLNNKTDMNKTNDSSSIKFKSIQGTQLLINLKTDKYPEETNWKMQDSTGKVIFTNGNLEKSKLHSNEYCLADGCYTFILYDNFGDGMCESKTDTGFVELVSNNNQVGLVSGCNFKDSVSIKFCVKYTGVTEVNNNYENIIKVYPNPFRENIYIQLPLKTGNATLINQDGQTIREFKTENSNIMRLNIVNLKQGFYILKVKTENNIYYTKVIRL